MEIMHTDKAPAAVGPYSQAVKTGNLLFCSGQIGLNPATGEMVGTTVAEQAKQVMFCNEAFQLVFLNADMIIRQILVNHGLFPCCFIGTFAQQRLGPCNSGMKITAAFA